MMKAFCIMEIIEVQNVHSIFDIQTSKSKIGDFKVVRTNVIHFHFIPSEGY